MGDIWTVRPTRRRRRAGTRLHLRASEVNSAALRARGAPALRGPSDGPASLTDYLDRQVIRPRVTS